MGNNKQRKRRFEADDIIQLTIVLGCFLLIYLGKSNDAVPDILKFSIGIIFGRRIQRRPSK
jgi:hypothetical protein